MGKTKSIIVLTLILVMVCFGIGYILSQEGYFNKEEILLKETNNKESVQYLEINGKEEIKSNKVIISDKFVGDFDPNGQVVVLDSTGSAYIVHKGVILTSDNVLIENNKEEYSVIRLNEPKKNIVSQK